MQKVYGRGSCLRMRQHFLVVSEIVLTHTSVFCRKRDPPAKSIQLEI